MIARLKGISTAQLIEMAEELNADLLVGVCWPIPDRFIGESMTKRVLYGNEIKVNNYKTGENARLVEVDTRPDGTISYRSARWSSYA